MCVCHVWLSRALLCSESSIAYKSSKETRKNEGNLQFRPERYEQLRINHTELFFYIYIRTRFIIHSHFYLNYVQQYKFKKLWSIGLFVIKCELVGAL